MLRFSQYHFYFLRVAQPWALQYLSQLRWVSQLDPLEAYPRNTKCDAQCDTHSTHKMWHTKSDTTQCDTHRKATQIGRLTKWECTSTEIWSIYIKIGIFPRLLNSPCSNKLLLFAFVALAYLLIIQNRACYSKLIGIYFQRTCFEKRSHFIHK